MSRSAESAERQQQQLAVGRVTDVGPGGPDGGVRRRRGPQQHLPHPAAPVGHTTEGGATRRSAGSPRQRNAGRPAARSFGKTQISGTRAFWRG